MAKVTTDEMIALLNADIKFAKMIGDKEFVGYLKEAKDKLLKEMGEAVAKEYVELFIKFAKMIGDKEFVGYLKKAKAKLLDAEYPTRHEEYAELFGK